MDIIKRGVNIAVVIVVVVVVVVVVVLLVVCCVSVISACALDTIFPNSSLSDFSTKARSSSTHPIKGQIFPHTEDWRLIPHPQKCKNVSD